MKAIAYSVGQLVAVLEAHGYLDAARFDGDPVELMDAVSEFGQGREIEPFVDAIPRSAYDGPMLLSAADKAAFWDGYRSQGRSR